MLSSKQIEPIEKLTELAMKVVLFIFILLGTAVLTGFFIYCVVEDKGAQAQTIAGFGDSVFFRSLRKARLELFLPKQSAPTHNRPHN